MIALWTAPQGGAWTRLPGPVTAWSILRTDRLGKMPGQMRLVHQLHMAGAPQ